MKATQRFENVVISGLAHVDAPHVVTSAEIEGRLAHTISRLGLEPHLLAGLAGIVERRVWDTGTLPSEMAAHAAELALADAGLEADVVGALLNTSVSRDYIEPSTASIVHGRLGMAPESINFDVGNACLGFFNGMNIVAAMIDRGEIDHALVVNAETSEFAMESTIERLARDECDTATFREQFATLTLGSGAVAMVLSRADKSDSTHRYLGGLSRSATQHSGLCVGQPDEMRTDTKGLLLAGFELSRQIWKEALVTFGWPVESIDCFAIHQVSKVHTEGVAQALEIDLDRIPFIYPTHGNMGPVGMPTVLSKAVADGTVTEGQRVLLMGVGSGLNAAISEVLW